MAENDWTNMICAKLNIDLQGKGLKAKTLQKIPYSLEISHYSESWMPKYLEPELYETDLLIYENIKEKDLIFPRVIVESKYERINTHAAITYNEKAQKHKDLMPQLRYGLMLGNWGNRALPGRLLKNGSNFDFMFRFVNYKPSDTEWKYFTEMLLKEVEYSKQLEALLHDTRSKYRKNYFMFEKQIFLEEQK